MSFPGGAVVKNLPANAGDTKDMGLIPGSGRSPGVGNGNPLQYPCLENSQDRGAWWAILHGVAKSWTRLRDWVCSMHKHTHIRAWTEVRSNRDKTYLRPGIKTRDLPVSLAVFFLLLLFALKLKSWLDNWKPWLWLSETHLWGWPHECATWAVA